MANLLFNNWLNEISKISIETIEPITSDTIITELNRNFKYNNKIQSTTVNTKLKNFFNNLSANTYNTAIVTMTQNLTDKIPEVTFTPTTIQLPATVTSKTITINSDSDEIANIFYDGIFSVPNGTVYFPTNNSNPPRVKNNSAIEFDISTNNYTGGGIIYFRYYLKSNFNGRIGINLTLQS